MGTLADLRADLVELLATDDAPAYDHLPKVLNPPATLIEPAEPYLTDSAEGLAFGQFEVAFDVFVLTGRAQNPVQVTTLDTQLEAVIDALDGSDVWELREVGQPFVLALSEHTRYLAAIVRVTTITRL